MLTLKNIFSKSLTSKCQNTFATTRVRNFFELDPIFPDQTDPDQHLDVKRLPFSAIFQKQHTQRNDYFEHFIREAHKKFPDEQRTRAKKLPMAVKEAKRDKALKKFASTILEDPDLGLPYGFGFDEYIQQLKMNNVNASNDIFLFTLNNLFDQLDAVNDFELVQFHKGVIIEKTKHNFEERAKAIILQRMILTIQQKRLKKPANKRLFQKLITDEAFLKKISASEWEPTEENVRELMNKIDPQRISNAASNLAKSNIDQTILVHKDKRLRNNGMDKVSEIQNRIRQSLLKGKIIKPARGNNEGLEDLSLHFTQYPIESVGLDAEQFRKFEIRSEINDVYITERDNYIDERYGEESRGYRHGRKLTSEEIEEEYEDKMGKEEEFFEDLVGDDTVAELERELGLTSKSSLKFKQIYNELDLLLKNAPTNIKATVNNTAQSPIFHPQAAHLTMNPDELFWGRLSPYLEPILPSKWLDNPHVDVPVMLEVLKPSQGNLPAFNQEPLEYKKRIELKEQDTFDVSELTQEMKREMEIFKMVKSEPYFKHYITNELNYYADRMNDHFAMIFSGIQMNETRPNDYLKFDSPKLGKLERAIMKQALNEPVLYHGRAYGAATRKTTKAMAVVKEGTGKIRVNRKDFLNYFGQTSERSLVIEPLMVSGYSIGLDVDLFLWGGGEHSQAEAGSLALARALVKYNPAVKVSMRENGLLNHDPRQTERKHVGLYKARAKFPYSRR